jgi:23S rRNA (cytidine2498-2'-O)-methyltransferase
MQLQAHIADPNYIDHLRNELEHIVEEHNDFIIAKAQDKLPVFALDTWLDPVIISIDSINDAAKQLQPHAKFWTPYLDQFARRTTLISEKLRYYKPLKKAQEFPLDVLPAIAQFTLLDKDRLIYATQRTKAIPNGQFNFIEDKINPPNRAYLKLWEALAILQQYPQPGDFALDLGASPGGWTYVLQNLGAHVLAIDKAPLDKSIARLPRVETRNVSAFSLAPNDFDHIDWMVCDMACYPDKLYRWLLPWIESNKVKQFIFTIKLQGSNDFASITPFQNIPGARMLHLQHNKHEVTLLLTTC